MEKTAGELDIRSGFEYTLFAGIHDPDDRDRLQILYRAFANTVRYEQTTTHYRCGEPAPPPKTAAENGGKARFCP